MNAKMDAVDMQNEKSDTEKGLNDEIKQELKDDVFKQVREVSHLVANARFQAQEADIRARYAAEFAERAVSEAQLAHMVASTLARTGRVVASMALELANNLSLDVCGDGDFLNFLPDSSYSMQSGDSSRISGNNSSFEDSFVSPAAEMNQARNPRRRSPPKGSPVPAGTKKHEAIYPEDISPESSLADLLSESKSLPTVWEDSYSNGWESTPESWANKKHTLQMLKKLHSRKEHQKPRDLDNDSDSEADSKETFPPIYLDGETQTTISMDKQGNHTNAGLRVELKTGDDNIDCPRSKSCEIQETVNDKLENMLEHVVKTNETDQDTAIERGVAGEMYKISGFGLDE